MSETSYMQATAAPRVFTIDGREYRIHALSDGDWAEFTAWVQDRWLDNFTRIVESRTKTEAEARAARLEGMKIAAGITSSSPHGVEIADSPNGTARLYQIAMRRSRPGVTIDEVNALLNDPLWRRSAHSRFLSAQGFALERPDEEPADPKSTPAAKSESPAA